ncbi:MAG: helix-hairpin-helix domain-containing protein, partial [Alkaliphilus sp.]|nr:helix-hairpin-helix domain-containing protein [Alkaliphilus sp.]
SFHRDKRSKTQKQSELDQIPGIGEKSKFELMQHFKSVKRLQKANLDEIAKIIGNNRASKVYLYFHKELKAQE